MTSQVHMLGQRRWQRIVVLAVLAYEGLGALAGGGLLVARPDGSLMDMPVAIMHGAFADFLIPGIILFALGVVNVVAFLAVLRRHSSSWIPATLALGGMTVWFLVEIGILRQLHWLHAMWGLPVLAGAVMATPLLPLRRGPARGDSLV